MKVVVAFESGKKIFGELVVSKSKIYDESCKVFLATNEKSIDGSWGGIEFEFPKYKCFFCFGTQTISDIIGTKYGCLDGSGDKFVVYQYKENEDFKDIEL